MKVFRIIPEFRILRLTFPRYNSFFDVFTVDLKIIYHGNLKYYYFEGILQVLKFEFQKFRILEILNFRPCLCFNHSVIHITLSLEILVVPYTNTVKHV